MRRVLPQQGRPDTGDAGARSDRQFERMQATALYCPKCREATPVREFLLLVLPNGKLYDYRCGICGTSTGSRTEKDAPAPGTVLKS